MTLFTGDQDALRTAVAVLSCRLKMQPRLFICPGGAYYRWPTCGTKSLDDTAAGTSRPTNNGSERG